MQLQEQAKERSLALLRTPAGLAFAPLKENGVLPPEEFDKMTEEEQKRIQADVEVMQEEWETLSKAPRSESELRNRLRELNRKVAGIVLNGLQEELATKFADQPDILAHLNAVRQDVNEHLADFLRAGENKHETTDGEVSRPSWSRCRRCAVTRSTCWSTAPT